MVGLLIGGVLSISHLLLSPLLSPLLTSVLVVLIWVIITGGIHIDGFIDTVDGLSAGGKRERILSVMEDGCVGAKGAASLFLLLFLKVILIKEARESLLLLTPMMARWAVVTACFFGQPAKSEGIGRRFIERAGIGAFSVASITTAFPLFFYFGARGVLLLLLFFLFSIGFIFYMKKRIGGLTGDTLGALCEMAEVLFLLSIRFLEK
jgi:adenosylcobinamide-GDP ribazoletransferase